MMDGFFFYPSFKAAIDLLDDSAQLDAYRAICQYAIDDSEPDGIDTSALAIFLMAKPLLDANKARKTNGMKGGRPKKTDGYETEKPVVFETETSGYEETKPNIEQGIERKRKIKEEKQEKEEKRFRKPTVKDVEDYCRERGNDIAPQVFWDFYEGVGWKVGTKPMKDWKACVRTWEQRRKEKARSGTNKFTAGIIKSDYSDYREEDLIAN